MRLLFETPEAAREVAFMLQCEYEGFTMITVPPLHDTLALRTAIELTGADFCFAGDHHPLVLTEADAPSQVSDAQAERISRKAELWQNIVPF
ncbi:MAG: hypothetical protein ACAF41_00195 (plasmid) [Leptolyngbya sp. BL-A-14]